MTIFDSLRSVQRKLFPGAVLLVWVWTFAGACSGGASTQAQASQQYRECVEASNGDLVVMRDCGIAEQTHWDEQRTAVFDRMLKSNQLDAASKNRLQAVQAAWDQFQRLNCWFECRGFPECGTAERLAIAECSWQMSRDRFLDLERLEYTYTSGN